MNFSSKLGTMKLPWWFEKKNQISRFENTNTGIKNLIDGLKGKLEPLMRREEKKGKGWNKEYAVKC